ncbi:MAG: hypothetical protein KGZ38_01010 [Erysipelothrix sp.]|nr:hypothetical protein [Erysipelothrix sp.]
MFYDAEKFTGAAEKFALDFNWDGASFLRSFESVTLGLSMAASDPSTAINVAIASVLGGGFTHDILKDNYSSHPGRELPVMEESQFIIKDTFMNMDEYDQFIEDPFAFLSEVIVPRVYNSLASPGSGQANAALIKLGHEIGGTLPKIVSFTQRMAQADLPPWYCALAPNPLDFLGAFVRNFDKLLLDLYRVPEKVKKTCEALAPVLAEVGKVTGKLSYELTGSKRVFCPVWYNTYLSPNMFKEFHWTYLKYMAEELIKAGFTPLFSFQGEHDYHLETILELPEGKAIAWFDKTDLRKAKAVVGKHSCIAGGVAPSLLIGGTPERVEQEVKGILDDMKESSGFIFTLPFNAIGTAKVEDVRAMTETVMKYGKY